MEYITFIESNDWENQTWNFYVPTKDNKTAIKELKRLLEERGDMDNFRLDEKKLKEEEVNKLVRNSGGTHYMNDHTKLDGVFDISQLLAHRDIFVVLCKGGIRDFMVT